MDLSPSKLIEHAKSPEGRKQLRYVGVSLVFVPLGQVLLQVLGTVLPKTDKGQINFVAAGLLSSAILTPFNFFANKYFVWKITSKENQRTQILVFWVAAMLGVSLAMLLTWVAQEKTAEMSDLVQRVVVFIAQLVGFGVVWVARYLVLDRWLFKITHHGEEPDAEEIDDLHRDFPI